MNKLESGCFRESERIHIYWTSHQVYFFDVTNIKLSEYVYIYIIYFLIIVFFIILECKNQSHKIQLYLCMCQCYLHSIGTVTPSLDNNSFRTRFELSNHVTDAMFFFTYTRIMYLIYTGRPLHWTFLIYNNWVGFQNTFMSYMIISDFKFWAKFRNSILSIYIYIYIYVFKILL